MNNENIITGKGKYIMERIPAKVRTRIEMSSRLDVIIRAAQTMRNNIITNNNLSHIKKQMEEIEQYSGLVRIDVDYLTNRNDNQKIKNEYSINQKSA
jgi:hypothetical protein